MKRLVCLLCLASALPAAELAGGSTVYIFPMSHGMDQYLANRLTNDHVLRVVTDPKLAEVFFSDRIGQAFQAQVDAAIPKPAPAKETAKPESRSNLPFGDPVNKVENPALNSAFGHSKGNVFLVDAKTHQVIWSTFDLPKDDTSRQLDRTASEIVNRIKKDLYPEKEKR